MFGLGHWELVAIVLIALLIFGPRLPKIARGIGKSIVGFRQGLRDTGSPEDTGGAQERRP